MEAVSVETAWQPGMPVAVTIIDGKAFWFKVDKIPGGFRLRHRGVDCRLQVLTPRLAELADRMPRKEAPDTSNLLLCPMPGLVINLQVKEGDRVEEGQPLAIVEAMKMENVLRAEKSAVVEKILVRVGDSLAVDAVMMEFAA